MDTRATNKLWKIFLSCFLSFFENKFSSSECVCWLFIRSILSIWLFFFGGGMGAMNYKVFCFVLFWLLFIIIIIIIAFMEKKWRKVSRKHKLIWIIILSRFLERFWKTEFLFLGEKIIVNLRTAEKKVNKFVLFNKTRKKISYFEKFFGKKDSQILFQFFFLSFFKLYFIFYCLFQKRKTKKKKKLIIW